jgi:hypothetical protein
LSKEKLYLDTSIISAYYDLKKPIRQLITQKWVENDIKKFDCYASTIVLKEIENNIDKELEFKMKDFINNNPITILDLNNEINDLAGLYRQEILLNEISDTLHIAWAYYEMDMIASWNFKHLVNFKTINTIHKINLQKNYNLIEILSLESIGGAKYGNL